GAGTAGRGQRPRQLGVQRVAARPDVRAFRHGRPVVERRHVPDGVASARKRDRHLSRRWQPGRRLTGLTGKPHATHLLRLPDVAVDRNRPEHRKPSARTFVMARVATRAGAGSLYDRCCTFGERTWLNPPYRIGSITACAWCTAPSSTSTRRRRPA